MKDDDATKTEQGPPPPARGKKEIRKERETKREGKKRKEGKPERRAQNRTEPTTGSNVKERQGRQGRTPEGTGTGENSTTPPSPGQGSRRERHRNRTVTSHPPGKDDGWKERRKREEGKAGSDQSRTDQNKGKNEDTTREHRKRTEGKPENSMAGKSADCLTLSFFHI